MIGNEMKTYANGQIAWDANAEAMLVELWNREELSSADIAVELGRTAAAVKTRATVLRGRGFTMRDKQAMPDINCLPKFTLPDGVMFQDDEKAAKQSAVATPRFYPTPFRGSGYSSTSGLIGGGRLHGR